MGPMAVVDGAGRHAMEMGDKSKTNVMKVVPTVNQEPL